MDFPSNTYQRYIYLRNLARGIEGLNNAGRK